MDLGIAPGGGRTARYRKAPTEMEMLSHRESLPRGRGAHICALSPASAHLVCVAPRKLGCERSAKQLAGFKLCPFTTYAVTLLFTQSNNYQVLLRA